MPFTKEQIDELKILAHYNQPTSLNGIKIHHTASAETIDAAKRLHGKGLIDKEDGGYLTDLGCEALVHLQSLLGILA